MSTQERQQAFETAVRARPGIRPSARFAENFGFSNSARVIEGGLFACTNNLEAYSKGVAEGRTQQFDQIILLCVLTFPPQDEVYFAIVVSSDVTRLNAGLQKLFRDGVQRNADLVARGEKTGKINNNVKFYLMEDGKLYFHNYDFRDSLKEDRSAWFDPDCTAQVDSLLFAIWPPAASARRSLLAREFVGYLGSLVGRERVHELRVWNDPGAARAEMRRMPSTLPIGEIEAGIARLGGHYPNGEIRRLHAALNFLPHKHFVILSGLSGTGKTQLALQYARTVHGLTDARQPDSFLFVCPVRPEWTDPSGLTGYDDRLSDRYVVPRFLEAVLVATAYSDSPVFVVLDEMNLARVEYYLSDVLSVMETSDELPLHPSGVPIEGTTGTPVPAALPLPQNLFLIGTINIDESTIPLSDKVLDRAIVLDMSSVEMDGFLTALETREPALREACTACRAILVEMEEQMSAHGLGFGYRVAEEAVRYRAFAMKHLADSANDSLDDLMVQKLLVKLRGSERQRPLLISLTQTLSGFPRAQAFLARLLAELDEFGAFQAVR